MASLGAEDASSEAVFAAFEELDALPVDVVRAELASSVGAVPDLTPPPLQLHVLSDLRDADVLDLGDVAEEQLRILGKSWDGADLDAFERLDGELDGSFAGTLRHRVVGGDGGDAVQPLYDVLTHGDGSGIVFRAGTPRVFAMIADGLVETRDVRVRAALGALLDEPAAEPEPKPKSKAKAKRATTRKKTSTAKKKVARKKKDDDA